MNLYIRTLGFDNMTSEAEAKFIKTGIRESIKEGFVIRHEKLDRGVIILRLSNSTGLYVYGRYEKNVFKYEYYFPFVVGKALSDNSPALLIFRRRSARKSPRRSPRTRACRPARRAWQWRVRDRSMRHLRPCRSSRRGSRRRHRCAPR